MDSVGMTQTQPVDAPTSAPPRLPLGALLSLAAAGFITIMLETMPAGFLPALSGDLRVSEAAAGQTVTVFAIGSIAAAIPVISLTMGWARRRLLLIALAGYVLTSVGTALSDSFTATLAIRFIAGIFAGVLWGILAGYARRLVAPEQAGKALTIALAGTPIALAVGTPAAAALADMVGWRWTFGVMALLAVGVLVCTLAVVPDFSGQLKGERTRVWQVFSIPGVVPVLVVTVLYVMAHNIFYTYISSFLAMVGLAEQVSAVLLTFGVASLIGLWITGIFIDRHLRILTISGTSAFALGMLALGILSQSPFAVFASIAVWGLAFGGASSLLQTAASAAAGPRAVDIAQSVLVTGWNLGIAAGGIVGGMLLSGIGAVSLSWTVFLLLVVALAITVFARKNAFPAGGSRVH